MEHESETPLLYSTVKRVGYKLALAAHIIFITTALIGTIMLLAVLLFGGLVQK